MQRPCRSINRDSPYFLNKDSDLGLKNETINQYIYRSMYDISSQEINLLDKSSIVENLEIIPDGTLTINHANPKKFDFKL